MMPEQKRTRRQWIRRLTDPDEPLTLAEFHAVPAALLLTETTPGELAGRLDLAASNKQPQTVLEIAILVLIHLRENVKDSREGTQHLEGMVGSLDEMLAASNEMYKVIASRRGSALPVLPPNGEALR